MMDNSKNNNKIVHENNEQEADNNFTKIPKGFYDNLPPVIKEACNLFEGESRDIFLLSLIVAYGASFSNVYTTYRGNKVFLNLYLAVYSRAAAGKSSLKFIRIIFDGINQLEINESKEENSAGEEKKEYRTLFIAPNITSASWAIQLSENRNNAGIILVTEAETLTKSSNSKDTNGFLDALRICSEGEPYEVMRKTDREHLIIPQPKLALLISGTPNQILKFIPTAEDGLASRMIYYSFVGSSEWKKFSKNNDFDIEEELSVLKKSVTEKYLFLKRQGKIKVIFTDEQFEKLDSQFCEWTVFGRENYGIESLPFIFRLAPRILKIAMILTVIKINPEKEGAISTVRCNDEDFYQSLALGYVLLKKAMLFLNELKRNQVHSKYHGLKYDLLMQLPESFITSEFLGIAMAMNIRKRTAEALLARFTEESLVYKIKKGHYANLFINIKTNQNEDKKHV